MPRHSKRISRKPKRYSIIQDIENIPKRNSVKKSVKKSNVRKIRVPLGKTYNVNKITSKDFLKKVESSKENLNPNASIDKTSVRAEKKKDSLRENMNQTSENTVSKSCTPSESQSIVSKEKNKNKINVNTEKENSNVNKNIALETKLPLIEKVQAEKNKDSPRENMYQTSENTVSKSFTPSESQSIVSEGKNKGKINGNTEKENSNVSKNSALDEAMEKMQISKTSASSSPQQVLSAMKQSLHLSWKPDKILGRNDEYKKIKDFLENGLRDQKGNSLYVAGAPGTGKTLLVRHIIDEITEKETNEIHVIEFNATGMDKNPKKAYLLLLEELSNHKKKTKLAEAVNMLKKKLVPDNTASWRRTKMSIIFIDEIDQLYTKRGEVLSNLFRWAKALLSKFLLIGVANTLDPARFLPDFSGDNDLEPLIIIFPPYDKDQLYSIMLQRMKQDQFPLEKNQVPFFDPAAIELCARKVSASTGDVRKCLNICSKCLDGVVFSKESTEIEYSISLFEMSSTIRSMFGASGRGGQEMFELIRGLPRHQKITLVLITLSIEHFPQINKPEKLEYMVMELRRVLNVPTVASYEYDDVITALCGVKLLKERKVKREIKFEVKASLNDLKKVLKNDDFVMKIILRGEARLKPYKRLVEQTSQKKVNK